MTASGSRTMRTVWQEHEQEIKNKVTNTTQVYIYTQDIDAAIRKIASKTKVPASEFIQLFGTVNESRALPQSTELAKIGEDYAISL